MAPARIGNQTYRLDNGHKRTARTVGLLRRDVRGTGGASIPHVNATHTRAAWSGPPRSPTALAVDGNGRRSAPSAYRRGHRHDPPCRHRRDARGACLGRVCQRVEGRRTCGGTRPSRWPGTPAFHQQPHRDWSVAALADVANMSRSAMTGRFKALVGVAPAQYVARWRMHLARTWLRTGRLTVAEVSSQLGYGSEASFSRTFERLVGKSPSAFRPRQQSRRGPS
jgi:AraC-like DNA-binding protein